MAQGNGFALAFGAFFVLALYSTSGGVNGECCRTSGEQCKDGTEPTGYFCGFPLYRCHCGYGPCNFAGCDCDGGCRRADGRRKREVNLNSTEFQSHKNTPIEIFKLVDVNLDGQLSEAEVDLFVANKMGASTGNPKFHFLRFNSSAYYSFAELDRDGSGYLDLAEVDAGKPQSAVEAK